MSEEATPSADRPCSACIHFKFDQAHPLHGRLCDRLDGRLLSADYERSLPSPSCGPTGHNFQAKEANPD